MNMVRTVKVSFWGDGLANASSFDIRDVLVPCHSRPEGAVSLTEDVRVEGVSDYFVYLAWDEKPKKDKETNVTLRLFFPQG